MDRWPVAVVAHLRLRYGEPLAVERLGGMSLGRVYRVRFASRSVIVKTSPVSAEADFYRSVAGWLRAAGVPIPELELAVDLSDSHWLVLEDIPAPLSPVQQDRWWQDERMLMALARLHATTRGWTLDAPAAPVRTWTDRVTDTALTCFPAAVAAELAAPLRRMQRESQHLREPWCWISGDPNPTNWGVRANGTLVLYDWERFQRGIPATDLAITVAGLGDRGTYAELAAGYATAWPSDEALPWSVETLARDIALAKVATVIEFICLYAEGAVRPVDGLIPALRERVPPWIHALSASSDTVS